MLVVVIAVLGVAVRTVKVVDVIAVLDGLVSAPLSVGVIVDLGDHVLAQRVLVVMVTVQMVRMTVMQVVDMAVVLHRDVAAGRPVPVVVIGVGRVSGHRQVSFRVALKANDIRTPFYEFGMRLCAARTRLPIQQGWATARLI